jgi:meso-butanediol dehydrogenase / (S,S)-butanediol dehydrogenase / diacetyl reductase
MRLSDSVCVVTGAARGIGKGIGLALAREGAKVVFADLDGKGAEAAAAEARAAGGQAAGAPVDVTDRHQVKKLIDTAVSTFGELNVMINNAGVSQTKPMMEITEAEWDRIMRVNGWGVLLCMQEAAAQMITQGTGGKIINAGSIASREGYPLFAHYCASKHAVHALTTAGARALAGHKITVNAYGPGVVATELWAQLDREFMGLGETKQPGEAMSGFASGILLGRVSVPEDVAGLVTFLASSGSDHITGQLIMVDGGMVLW